MLLRGNRVSAKGALIGDDEAVLNALEAKDMVALDDCREENEIATYWTDYLIVVLNDITREFYNKAIITWIFLWICMLGGFILLADHRTLGR